MCEPANVQHQYCEHNVLIISAEVDTMSSMAYLKLIISIASLKETFLLKCKLHKCTIAIQPNPKNLYFKDLIILFWAPSWLSPMSSFYSSWLHRPGEMELLLRYWWQTPTSPGGTSSPYSSPSSRPNLFLLPFPSPSHLSRPAIILEHS